MFDIILQTIITVLTIASLVCLTRNHKWYYKLGPVFGVLVQPFWIILAIKTNSWSLYIICPIYFILHAMACYRLFYVPRKKVDLDLDRCWLTRGCKGKMSHTWQASFCNTCGKESNFEDEV